MPSLTSGILVFLGAGLGGVLRHGLTVSAMRIIGPGFPYGTLAVNVVGSFFIGLLAGGMIPSGVPGQSWRLFLITGLLGGFTTFSTFSLDAVLLYQQGRYGLSALYVVASVGTSLAAVIAGLALVRQSP